MMEEVLVLNNNYQPLNVTNMRRAVALLCLGKAEMVQADSKIYRSERSALKLPTVVRLHHYVRRPIPVLKVSRKSVFARDGQICQYCGQQGVPLTLDHIVPRERGCDTCWENLACCCTRCNNLKANRTPDEAGMSLLRPARRPKYIPYLNYTKFVAATRNPHWQAYLAPYTDLPLKATGHLVS